MSRPKRQPPKNTVIVSFSVFCSSCATELREVTDDDTNGDTEFCVECGMPVKIIVGISVNANTTEEVRYTMREMQESIPLIHKILSQWNSNE